MRDVGPDPAQLSGVSCAAADACTAVGDYFVRYLTTVPLVEGLVDSLNAANIPAFGPSRLAARLEGSKGFTKDLCRAAGIPTADYARFEEEEPALAYLRAKGAPIVLKADGLAAGKGVVVAQSLEEAEAALSALFATGPGASVVIEAFLEGEEAALRLGAGP